MEGPWGAVCQEKPPSHQGFWPSSRLRDPQNLQHQPLYGFNPGEVGTEESHQIPMRTTPPPNTGSHHAARPRSPPRFLQTVRWLGNTSRLSPWQPRSYPRRPGTRPAGWPGGGGQMRNETQPGVQRQGRAEMAASSHPRLGRLAGDLGKQRTVWMSLCPPRTGARQAES